MIKLHDQLTAVAMLVPIARVSMAKSSPCCHGTLPMPKPYASTKTRIATITRYVHTLRPGGMCIDSAPSSLTGKNPKQIAANTSAPVITGTE